MSSILTPDIGQRWRRMRSNPLRSLTPQSLGSAIESFDAGYLRQAALLWENIEDRDDVLQIAGPKRRKAVSRQSWEILTVDDSPEAARQAEILTAFWNNVKATEAIDENVRGGLKLLVRQMMKAPFQKYSAHEVVWKTVGGQLRAEFRWVPLYFFENTTGRLRYIGPEGAMAEGVPLPENEWLITTADSAMMKAASICHLFKRMSLQDWLNFSEKFGVPGIHGKTDAAPGTEEWNKFVSAMESFANDWVAVTNRGAEISLIEVRQNGDGPFAPMVERMDRRIAALCRGADLSTMSRENGMGASLQGDEESLLLEDDCEMISEALEPLSRFVLQWAVGTDEPLAYIQFQPPLQKDTNLELAVDAFLLSAGAPMAVAATLERYGRPQPEEGEPLLSKPVAPEVPMPGTGVPPQRMAFGANDMTQRVSLERFMTAARAQIAEASAEDLSALREAVRTVAAANDGDFPARLRTLAAKLKDPEFIQGILAGPRTRKAFEAALGTALIGGAAENTPTNAAA